MARRRGTPKPLPAGQKRKVGRPKEDPPTDVCDAVLEWIASGKTLAAFCRQPGMPCRKTVDSWRQKDVAFAAAYARARDDGYEVLLEDCLAIADDSSGDLMVTEHGERMDTEFVQRSKLRIETRMKILAIWNPARYGQKQTVAVGGDPNAPPIRLSDVEREAKLKALLAMAEARRAKSEPADTEGE